MIEVYAHMPDEGKVVITYLNRGYRLPIPMIDGEVHNPGNITWQASYSAKDYLNLAGGLTAYGDKKHIVYITPYGEASRINVRSNASILPGSIIRVSEKPLSEQSVNPDRFQQISSLVTSLVTIAILANSIK